MRIKKVAEAKHEAAKSPATTEFLNRALAGSLPSLLEALRDFPRPWSEPKGDLYHWIPLLNAFDLILAEFNSTYSLKDGPQTEPFGSKLLRSGVKDQDLHINLAGVGDDGHLNESEDDEALIRTVLDFGRLLLDNCANRTLYNSSEHVEPLLNSTSQAVVVSALHLGSRFAATYYRSNHHRPNQRQGLNSTLLQIHYRVNTDHVQKLAEPFSVHLQRSSESAPSQPQTPSGKGKEFAQGSTKKSQKQGTKVHPSDLLAFVEEVEDPTAISNEFGGVYFDVNVGSDNTNSHNSSRDVEQALLNSAGAPGTPTPLRRSSGPSGLSRATVSGESTENDTSMEKDRPSATDVRRMLVVPPQEIEDTDLITLMKTYLPRLPNEELGFAFLTKARFAKAMQQGLESRQMCVAIRILAITNVAFLYPESTFTQKIVQQDSQLPRELQLVYQLTELVKPRENHVPDYLRALALEALVAISIRHKSKHSDICNALGINVNHGIIFQLVREVDRDLRSDCDMDASMLDKHERIFNLLDSLLSMSFTSRTGRSPTVDTLVSAGLFGILVEILGIRSAKAQHAQNRAILFVHEASRQARDGIRIFANASGLDTLSHLIAWEVDICLKAVASGQGISPKVKSKVMDYSVPIWHQQTLRTALKFVNHLLSQQTIHVERLLRNLIDSPHLLNAMKQIIGNGATFGSNIYANIINMVSTFIHNEPQSYSIIQEAGISHGLLDSISSHGSGDHSSSPVSRKLPMKKSPEDGKILCGRGDDVEVVDTSRSEEEQLAGSILCSTDVLMNLPHSFGALCLTNQGLQLFLGSRALESYFEVFESAPHVKTIASEKDLATFIGNTFDELVRHHPDLRTAVLRCLIMTLARLVRKCRATKPAPNTEISNSAVAVGKSASEDSARSEGDITMSGTSDPPDVFHEVFSHSNESVSAATYITIFCRFLNGFFTNQQMASLFLDNGGLPFVLDMCAMPSLPYYFVSDPGFDNSYDLTKTIHMLAEARPSQTIPLVLSQAQEALGAIQSLTTDGKGHELFVNVVSDLPFDATYARSVTQGLTKGLVYLDVLQELLSHSVFAHARERAWSPLTAVNVTEMWVDLITQAGNLSRFCTWEAMTLLDNASEGLELASRLKGNGIGSEANSVLGVGMVPPLVRVTASDGDFYVSTSRHGEESEGQDLKFGPQTRIRKSLLYNTKIIRHLLTTVPNVVSSFFLNIGGKAVTKRMFDYARQNMFMIVEAVAEALMSHFTHEAVAQLDSNSHQVMGYKVVILDMVRRVLNINDVDSGPPSHFMTIIFLALRNNSLFPALKEMLLFHTKVVLDNSEQEDVPPKNRDTLRSNNIDCARSVMRLILILYGCAVSSKFVVDSSQSSALATSSRDPTNHQYGFSPSQFLVEVRAAVLPTVESVWFIQNAEKLASSPLRRIIRILKTVLDADNENKAHKRQSDLPVRDKAKHKTLTLKPGSIRQLNSESKANGDKWPHDLIVESLYRSNNDVDMAKDYAEARSLLQYPRFPPPSYDVEPSSVKIPESSPRRDSQSTIPEQDIEADSAPHLVHGSDGVIREETPDSEGAIPNPQANQTGHLETDDDRRMAMSIDNVLNITERERSESSKTTPSTPKAAENEASYLHDRPHPPIEVRMNTDAVAIEDLDSIRNTLRERLITRVLDILSIHENLTVDLSELLKTAASKVKDHNDAVRIKEKFSDDIIFVLLAFGMQEDIRDSKQNIAACANLLARLMQDRDFYEACRKKLFENSSAIEIFLGFVKMFPDTPQNEGHPWIGHVLLIFEKLLSEELRPKEIQWQNPRQDEPQLPFDGQIAGYVEPILEESQRNELFDSIVAILPHIGKDQSQALSVVRILAMLTRHPEIANKLAVKQNLQRLFLMVKQMAGVNIEAIQSSFMLILRHVSEDEETIRRTMRNTIVESFVSYRSGELSKQDTTHFIRHHHSSILRSPKLFLEVTNEVLEIPDYDPETKTQTLALKKDIVPKTFTPWEPQGTQNKTAENGENASGATEVIQSTEANDGAFMNSDRNKTEVKPPVVERPDGLVHFLLSQLLSYRTVEDKEPDPPKSKEALSNDSPADSEMDSVDTDVDDGGRETTGRSGLFRRDGRTSKPDKKEDWKAEDHPIYYFRCFLLQCLTEMLISYNHAKVEFINFSRKADPKAMTPSKPRSGVLNYLLVDLIPLDHLTRETSLAACKKQGTSTWAMSVIVALCMRTPETYRDNRDPTLEAKDNDLLFVRRFVIENAVKAYRDIQSSTEFTPEVKYARLLSVSDLFNRILMGRVLPVHSSMAKQPGETEPRSEMHKTQVARIMYEKNLISVLTASCSEIDLNVPNAKRAIKYILRPLKSLTFTAIEYSKESDSSTTPGQSTEGDDISTATSVSDMSDVREETPDLFRHSALGMLDAGRGDEDESEESEDEDEEMYDDGYDEGLPYSDDDMDQVDDDEAVSDPDEDDEMGPIEGRNGDMVMDIEVIHSEGDGSDDDDDEDESDDDESSDDDDDDDDSDAEPDDDEDPIGGEVEIYEEDEGGDGGSLDDDHEHEWRDIDDDEEDVDDEALMAERLAEELRTDEHGRMIGPLPPFLSGGLANGLLPDRNGNPIIDLNDEEERDRYIADMELVHDDLDVIQADEPDDLDDEGDDDEDDEDDDEDADDEDAFMYETYDDDEDNGLSWNMDEAFELITGRTSRPHHHHHHHHHGHEHHGGLRGVPFGRVGDLTFMTSDGRPSMLTGHNPIRVHRNGGAGPRGPDEGVNPLLARNPEDSTGNENPWRHQHGNRAFHRGVPGLMHAVLGGPMDRANGLVGGLGGLMNAVPDILRSHWGGGGNIMINATIPEELEFLMGGGIDPRGMRFDLGPGASGQRTLGNNREDAAQPPHFTPVTTGTRWQEEAKLLFPNGYLDHANTVLNSILKMLVPASIERAEIQKAEEAKRREEARKKEEEEEKKRRDQEEKERQEREEKERQEREQREREEEEQRQREAEQEATRPKEEEGDSGAMELDRPSNVGAESSAEGTTGQATGPSEDAQPRPRVMTRIRDRDVDITDLGIDADYIEALPEDFREEVVMSALQEQRTQTADTGQAPAELNQEFLDALPEELRDEIIQQDQMDRRRRERQEVRRREQESTGAAQGEDMDPDSFFATLDEDLRRSVVDGLTEEELNGLPASIRREAQEMHAANRRHREAVPPFGYGMGRRAEVGNNWGGDSDAAAQARAKERRPIVQMLDKQGIATVLRLLFIPQQGSLKESLNTVFENLAQNRQNRAELISLLLALLQDGSSDPSAVERSYASLTYRAKQREGSQMTPKQLKRTLTGNGPVSQSLSPEMTPTMFLTQCLAALGHLSQFNPHVQGFFVNEHETSATLRRRGKGKEKERDTKAQKFALNALLSLLDKKMIMENAGCMEHLSSLLQHVTQPLTILLRREREEKEREAKEKKEREEKEKAEAATKEAGQADGGDGVPTTRDQNTDESKEASGSGQNDAAKKEEGKKQRNLVPPVIPEQHLRLVINIITAKECNSKIFRDTISIITNLSAIPGAKDVFGKELVKQAQELGGVLAYDLTELLSQLNRDASSDTVQTSVLAKFSSSSSDQTKLLRVLTALDYLFDPKRNSQTQNSAAESEKPADTKPDLLSSLYDSPTFAPVWSKLSDCLRIIRSKENVTNVATILLPLIEALMVVCKNTSLKENSAPISKSQQFTVSSPEPESAMDTLFFRFTEEHRKILNDLVRNNPRLMSGTFSLLVKNPKVLEFDNKRNFFTRRLHTRDDARRSQPSLQLNNIRRDMIFSDSYKLLFFKKPEEIKYGKLNIKFIGEEGVDAGGVSREWFQSMSRQMFDPNYVLFQPVASDRTTFHPNKLSYFNQEHLSYFKFVGRIIGKAMYEGRPLDCHFSRAVYKRILGRSVSIKDMETLDLDYYKSLLWMLENDITDIITETFSLDEDAFGETQVVDLIPNGRNIPVTEENKHDFVQKVVEYRLTGSVQEQLEHFLTGFHDIVPANLINIFNEQELELLISGLPEIDLDDWKANTEYHNYNQGSAQIQWFWRAVRSFDKEERAKLLQFVTGTSKVPLNGFKELEGMNGFSKFNIHRDYGDKERLPSSHTCFNQLDLPEYDDYETLRHRLYTAMTAGGEYFGFA